MTHSLIRARVRKSLYATGLAAAFTFGIAGMVGPALADPIALILDKSEAVQVSAFTELMPGDVVELGADGYIDLLDYAACQEVRVKSGKISVSSSGYALDGGQQEVLRAGNCLQADSGSGSETADKGLTVTLRGLALENKKAASLMLRFDDRLRDQYDTVFVSFAGGQPKRFDVLDNIMTEMPDRDAENEAVDVELFLQGKAPDYGVVMRKFTIDPAQVGRKTAVVIVK
ncbi:hypothetical protein [Roseibium marinum]|uniref:Uncharacterized protein n=1 Tax=Roseibium marinum TaxID=281252 RepID=A0A2S3UNF5_9HYPH|nr:hypothetical protein [Roseibium marinum]POF29248.1 hypothetical protein CLV41_10918 [Roseibium marinum]